MGQSRSSQVRALTPSDLHRAKRALGRCGQCAWTVPIKRAAIYKGGRCRGCYTRHKVDTREAYRARKRAVAA